MNKQMKKMTNWFLLTLISIFLFSGCIDDEQSARLRITLVDSPGDFDAVNVDIQGVSVHANAQAGDNDPGWIEFDNSNVGVKNLLDYTGGTELTLVDTDFPAGRISQIRLLLGDENTVVVDGSTEQLVTPSAKKSGLKLLVNETLRAGVTYNFMLDFEAARSVVCTGSGKFILKPVIKVKTDATKGAIKGSVIPAEENVAVYVINGEDTVSTTYASSGVAEFLATGIPEGQYMVSFDPGEESDYAGTSLENVDVSSDDVTDVGETELELK